MPKVLKTSETPNPHALRFHLDHPIIAFGSRDFPTVEKAQSDPLAARLFEIPYVTAVFYLGSSITVTKDEEAAWENLITPVADGIEETLSVSPAFPASPAPGQAMGEASSLPALDISGQGHDSSQAFATLDKAEQWRLLQAVFDEAIRPGLQGDGGDLELVDCDAENVIVRYAGACGSCPSSATGTLAFIEQELRSRLNPRLTVHLA